MRKSTLSLTITTVVGAIVCVGCFHVPTVSSIPDKVLEQAKAAKAGKLAGLSIPVETGLEGPNETAQSFSDGKQAAKQDFNRTVSWATAIALWILIPLSIVVLIASFFVAWIPTRAAVWGAVGAAGVAGARYALLVYGTIAVDLVVYVSAGLLALAAVFVGIPLVFSWVNRRIHKKGEAMSDPQNAVAVLSTVNEDVAKDPVKAAAFITAARSGIADIAEHAKSELAKIGVTA